MKTSECDKYIAAIIALVYEYGKDMNALISKDTLINMPKEGHVEYTTQPNGDIIVTILREELEDAQTL